MPDDQPSAAASSPGSWAAGNPFVGDPGPTFDPETAEQQPATPLHVLDVAWQADRVKTIFRAQGLLTHEAVGVGEEDWLWRASELEALGEPMANTMNKVPVLRAAAAVSDELTAGAVLFEYAARSIKERAHVLRARKAQPPPRPQPITGVDAAGERVTQPGAGEVNWEVPE